MKIKIRFEATAAMQVPPVHPRGKLYVISDVHGCIRTLEALLKKIKFTPGEDFIYQTGDLVDRGPGSKQVIDLCMRMEKQRQMQVLMGNHENMLLDAYDDPSNARHWLDQGGRETLDSFAVKRVTQIPDQYIDWIRRRPYITRIPYDDGKTYVISHAGVNLAHPKPFRDSKTNAVYVNWNRERHPSHPTLINIVGHSIKSLGEIKKSLNSGTIYLDGGCVSGGKLVAFDMDEHKIVYVSNREFDLD